MKKEAQVKKILFFTLSNLGDVILTLPVLDALRARFPHAHITAMIGPRPREVLQETGCVDKLIIYDKHAPLREKIRLFRSLSKERFDAVIDLRNTLYGAFLPARYRTSPFLMIPRHIRHMRQRNLYRLNKALGEDLTSLAAPVRAFSYQAQDKEYIDSLLFNAGVKNDEKILVISHATGGPTRRWEKENFVALADRLHNRFRIIFIGAKTQHDGAQEIIEKSSAGNLLNFTGLTSLRQLAYLLTKAACVLTCDTGTVHIASYMNAPVVALFGPGDDFRYSPWSDKSETVSRDIHCRPCQTAQCRFQSVTCMSLISTDEVISRIDRLLSKTNPAVSRAQRTADAGGFRRILICRTDRIGDVVLSTPVFRTVRQHYPNAYIAVLVGPQARDIVQGNPHIDRFFIYDKRGIHRGFSGTLRFIRRLRNERFDLALILHPTNRMHIVAWGAAIPRRIGYDRKLSFLLTDKVSHQKQQGRKHEVEYNYDILAVLGITDTDYRLYMPMSPEAESWARRVLDAAGVSSHDKLLALHPGASCPSKIWPAERFAQAADTLAERYGFIIVVVAGRDSMAVGREAARKIKHKVLDLSGETSVAGLASIFRRCRMLISNDSGPVHIAAAVGIPVVSIFGRSQEGLNVKRWGPVGRKTAVLHRDVGCVECLAHNCRMQFACLKAIGVEDVVKAAESVME